MSRVEENDERSRTNNYKVIKELHRRIADLDDMLAEETRQLKEMTAQMEKTSLKKAIDLIMAQPPELHYPVYYADLLREKGSEKPNSSETIYRQAAIDAINCDITITGKQNAEVVAETIASFVDRIKALPSAEPKSTRTFVELVVEYPDPEFCAHKEYKGKPYYSIKYTENGQEFIGYGTYKPEVLSEYLKEYFCPNCGADMRKEGTWDRLK